MKRWCCFRHEFGWFASASFGPGYPGIHIFINVG